MSSVDIFNCVHCGTETNDKEEFRFWRTQFISEYSDKEFERVENEIHRYHKDDEYYSGVCIECAVMCINELKELDYDSDCDKYNNIKQKLFESYDDINKLLIELEQVKEKLAHYEKQTSSCPSCGKRDLSS